MHNRQASGIWNLGLATLRFLESYLYDSSLIVKFVGTTTKPFYIFSGFPRVLTLALCFSTCFVNGIVTVIDSNFLMFADDIKIFTRVESVEQHLQLDVNICSWCEANAMEVNILMCNIITYTKGLAKGGILNYELGGDKFLRRVDKFLSIVIFPGHILSNLVTSRASSLLGFAFRTCRDLVKLPLYSGTLNQQKLLSHLTSPWWSGLRVRLNNLGHHTSLATFSCLTRSRSTL